LLRLLRLFLTPEKLFKFDSNYLCIILESLPLVLANGIMSNNKGASAKILLHIWAKADFSAFFPLVKTNGYEYFPFLNSP